MLMSVGCASSPMVRSSGAKVGVSCPPAASRSTAVDGVHSENQLKPLPVNAAPLAWNGVPLLRSGTRPASTTLPSTRSPRASRWAVASPSTSTGPPEDTAPRDSKTLLARVSVGSDPP